MDRDGTICEEVNYLARAEDLKLFPFAAKAINLLRKSGYLIILVTNQSGIGRGFFDEEDLSNIHAKLIRDLRAENAELDAIYYCPHISSDKCECRKPKSGMILQAKRDFELFLPECWMIGDKFADVQAGASAGTLAALVLTGYGNSEVDRAREKADLVGENLLEISKAIAENASDG